MPSMDAYYRYRDYRDAMPTAERDPYIKYGAEAYCANGSYYCFYCQGIMVAGIHALDALTVDEFFKELGVDV